MTREPILIAGGGIGGAAATLVLARQGWPVQEALALWREKRG